MNQRRNPATVPPPQADYVHAVEIPPNARWLSIAGQVGADFDGNVPAKFEDQAELVFTHLGKILEDAGMGFDDVVKATVFLTHPEDIPALRDIRRRHMGEAMAAQTLLVVARLANPAFRIEVEMTAAKG